MQAVKYALLALLEERSRHGYDLKGAFEDLVGGTWELNVGQVYTTLGRLERDRLVTAEVVPQDLVPDRKVYSITEDGRKELRRWLEVPSAAPVRLRNELVVKVLVGALLHDEDPVELIARQRREYLRVLGELAALSARDDVAPPTRLLLEGAMLHVEADLRWLDLCETRLGKGARA